MIDFQQTNTRSNDTLLGGERKDEEEVCQVQLNEFFYR